MKPKPKHFDGYCAFDPEGKVICPHIISTESIGWNCMCRWHYHVPENMKQAKNRLRKEGYRVAKVKMIETWDEPTLTRP